MKLRDMKKSDRISTIIILLSGLVMIAIFPLLQMSGIFGILLVMNPEAEKNEPTATELLHVLVLFVATIIILAIFYP
jgi:hypothetical protein